MLSGALAIAILTAALQDTASSRIRYTINEHWQYSVDAGDSAQVVDFQDAAWQFVDLPHTWNAEDAFSESRDYRRGVGWYRKRLNLDPALSGKRLFLFFEGANQVADVYVNGRPAGRHIGGYTAFTFDITELVRFDAANVIAVRVDNRHSDAIPPLNADFTFYGGIYRDVWLVATDPVHIEMLNHGSSGVFIDTPLVGEQRATVRARARIVNETRTRKRLQVVHHVLDAEQNEVATIRTRVDLAAGASANTSATSSPIARPRLWSPDQPNLYRVVTEVREGTRVLDRLENPLGFRWFTADAQRGFMLNGRPLRLYGTNRHQDRAGYANALPDWAHREDVRTIKATGFNFLRLAHYPQDPAVLDAMDRIGLIGWEEIPVVNIISLAPEFADNAERMLIEMIRQHYNHPAILFWGYMNEILLRKPDPMPEGYRARVLALAKRLDARAHAEDATRKTVMAISMDEIDDGSGVQEVSDILGFNLYFGWYYRALDGLGVFLDSLHARHPNRPLMVSEYGAGSDQRIHSTDPKAFDFSTEYQQRFHEMQLPQLVARDYLIATAVWNQFDFGSKGRHDSKPNLNQKGLLYFDRQPKDIWFYYRALLSAEPLVHIATRDRPRRAGSRATDASQPVVAYTNDQHVELLVNGVSAGVQLVENAAARWTVTLREGENQLEARTTSGSTDKTTVIYEDRTSLFGGTDASTRVVAVNTGASYEYVDASGTVWEADHPYQAGSWGHINPGQARLKHHRIFGSPEDALYQSYRDGTNAYRFDVSDGSYEVRLLFAENDLSTAGQRVFDVTVNGIPVFRDLDLAREFGQYTAVERTVVATASRGAGITIRLSPSIGTTTISGIMLRKL